MLKSLSFPRSPAFKFFRRDVALYRKRRRELEVLPMSMSQKPRAVLHQFNDFIRRLAQTHQMPLGLHPTPFAIASVAARCAKSTIAEFSICLTRR